jgi:hypothetical protein
MQKLVILLFLFSTFNLFSQSFPGEDANLFLNKIVKVAEFDESLQKYHYKNFFNTFDIEKKELPNDKKKNKPFGSGLSYSPVSEYSKLVGKEFKVTNVYELEKKYSFSKKEFVLELQNQELGIIFYKYNSKYEHDLEIEVVGGLEFPEGFYCKDLSIEEDKFEKVKRSYSPYVSGVSFMKNEKGGKVSIYMSIRESGATLNVNEKGLYLLLENDKRISRPNAEIDVDAGSGSNYVYSAFIELSKKEIDLLLNNKITDDKLYIYTGEIGTESAKKIQEYLKCIIK